MKKWIKNIGIFAIILVWLLLSVAIWIVPDKAYSDAERRNLAKFPNFSTEFGDDFDGYLQDQFPLREKFRSLKAMSEYYLWGKKDNNGIFVKDGYAAKLVYPYSQADTDNFTEYFSRIYRNHLQNSNVYLSVIPDKGYFYADLKMDYEQAVSDLCAGMPFATYIDLFPTLSLENYYRTDTHWKQETLSPAANALRKGLGVKEVSEAEYSVKLYTEEFSGVYLGQSALPLKKDTIWYIESDLLKNCTVKDVATDKIISFWTPEAAEKDGYNFFLGGSLPLIEITNPAGEEGKELVLFRDSFSSSLGAWMVDGYSKVTLVDMRYMSAQMLGSFVDFDGADVLFIYSTLLTNQNRGLFK